MSVAPGVYYIKNVKANRYLDSSPPAHLWIMEKHVNPSVPDQEWELHPIAGGAFNIKAVYGGGWIYCATSTKGAFVTLSQTDKTDFEILPTEQSGQFNIYYSGTERVVDLTSGSVAEGATVDLMTAQQTPEQSWSFEKIRDFPVPVPLYTSPDLKIGRYILRSTSVGTVIDLTDGKKADGTAVTAQTYREGKTNQLWDVASGAKGYNLKNVASGSYLSPIPQSASFTAGVNVTGHSNPAEYTVKKVGTVFQITHVGSGLNLDLAGNSAKDGAGIILWTGSDGPNQKWDFQPHA